MSRFIFKDLPDGAIFVDRTPDYLEHADGEMVELSFLAISGILANDWATSQNENILIELPESKTLCRCMVIFHDRKTKRFKLEKITD